MFQTSTAIYIMLRTTLIFLEDLYGLEIATLTVKAACGSTVQGND